MNLDKPITVEHMLVLLAIIIVPLFAFGFWRATRKPIWDREVGKTGVSWRKAAPYLGLLAFVLLYPFVPPFLHAVTSFFYGIGAQGTASLGNANSAEIAADQLAGGGVQYGTFFTKLWITVIFYLLFTGLPWWVQRFTHPAPTAWAKDSYKTDFNGLEPTEKFASYGRMQLTNTIKVVGAAMAAALLV